MNDIVRTPTQATGGVTPEELAQMAVLVTQYTALAFRTDKIEKEKITPAIKELYKVSSLKEPRVVIVSSPLVMAIAGSMSAAILHMQVESPKEYALSPNLPDTTNKSSLDCYVAILECLGLPIPKMPNVQSININDFDFMAVAKCFTKNDKSAKWLIAACKTWSNAYQGGNMWAGYSCYIAAMRDVLKLQLPEFITYQPWEDCTHNGGFRFMQEEFCIVSDFPEFIKIDDNNQPHCVTGPSYKWRDGWSLYHWHGVEVPEVWINDKPSLKAEVAITWENIEQRRAACEIVGWHNILRELQAKTIHKDTNPQIGELVEVTLPDIGKERFLRVLCGTGREFALSVPKEMQIALEANAWTWNLSPEEYAPEIRT